MPSLSLALLLSNILSAELWRLKVGKPQTGHAANDMVRIPMLASLLSIVLGRSADNPDVDIEHSMVFNTTTNSDLCDFLKSFQGFSFL